MLCTSDTVRRSGFGRCEGSLFAISVWPHLPLGRLWLVCAREACVVFRQLAVRMANYGDQTPEQQQQPQQPQPTQQRPSSSSDISAPYTSPLLALRSYRVSPNFASAAGDRVWHASYSNNVAPSTPLCRFELGGLCNDPDCQFLHRRDYEITTVEAVLQDLARYANQERLAEVRAALANVDMEGPASAVSPQVWQLIIQILARGTVSPSTSGPARNDVLPRTCHFEVVRPHQQHSSSADGGAQDGSEPGRKKRRTDAAADAPSLGYIPFVEERDVPSTAAATEHEDGLFRPQQEAAMDGEGTRFHDAGLAVDAQDPVVTLLASEHAHNVELWLKLTRSHLLPGGSALQAAAILAQALELNERSAALWIVYLTIYLNTRDKSDTASRLVTWALPCRCRVTALLQQRGRGSDCAHLRERSAAASRLARGVADVCANEAHGGREGGRVQARRVHAGHAAAGQAAACQVGGAVAGLAADAAAARAAAV